MYRYYQSSHRICHHRRKFALNVSSYVPLAFARLTRLLHLCGRTSHRMTLELKTPLIPLPNILGSVCKKMPWLENHNFLDENWFFVFLSIYIYYVFMFLNVSHCYFFENKKELPPTPSVMLQPKISKPRVFQQVATQRWGLCPRKIGRAGWGTCVGGNGS